MRRTGKRNWLPYRQGATLVLDEIGLRTWESHDVGEEVDEIRVDVIEKPGYYADWTTFAGSASEPAKALEDFLAFLDASNDARGSQMRPFQSSYRTLDAVSHIGWLDPNEDPRSSGLQRASCRDEEDDGGLSAVRAERASSHDAQAEHAAALAREHFAKTVDELVPHHAALDAAFQAHDERCAKAVGAFLPAAAGLAAADGHTVWSVDGKMNPGSEIEHPFAEAVIVRPDGAVLFHGHGHRPRSGRDSHRAAHPSYQPQIGLDVVSDGSYYDSRWCFRRRGHAIAGQLPFYVSAVPPGVGGGWVRGANAFSEAELSAIPEVLARTADFFVRALARYLEDHGR